MLVGFLLNFLDGAGRFSGMFPALRGEFLLPLFKRKLPFGKDRLRSRFPSGRLNLLPGVGDQARYLARQLKGSVSGACGSRKNTQVVVWRWRRELRFACG